MHTDEVFTIDNAELETVTGGGLLGGARKLWNATRGARETVTRGVQDAGAWVGLRAEEFGKMPLKDQATTVAALSGAVSAPAAAAGALYNAFKK